MQVHCKSCKESSAALYKSNSTVKQSQLSCLRVTIADRKEVQKQKSYVWLNRKCSNIVFKSFCAGIHSIVIVLLCVAAVVPIILPIMEVKRRLDK